MLKRSEKSTRQMIGDPLHGGALVLGLVCLSGCAMPNGSVRPSATTSLVMIDREEGEKPFHAVSKDPATKHPQLAGKVPVDVPHNTIASTVAYTVPIVEVDSDPNATAQQSPSDLVLLVPEQSVESNMMETTPSTAQRNVQDLVDLALAGHPRILAARQRVAAVFNRIPQAEAMPDPKFNNVFWPIHDQSLQTAGGRIGNQMSLTQAVPLPEKLRTRAAVVRQELHIAQAQVEQIELEIKEAVHLAYYEVWFASRAMAITESNQQLVLDLKKVAEARYRSGGTQQDVLRARLEFDRLDDQLVQLRQQKQMAQADLAALLQQPLNAFPEAELDLNLDSLANQLDDRISAAERCNPKLKGIAWEIQRDRERQKLACLQRYPDLQVGLHWGLVSDDANVLSPIANGHDTISFNVGTTLPIWRKKIQSGIQEASHLTSNSRRRLEAERDSIYAQIRRLTAQADAFMEQRNIYINRIIPRTEQTLTLSIADYRGKRTDFFSMIETYRELLLFETQLARIEATLAGTLAQIDRAVGCP